jgi:DNA sulfur modification protein DndC
MIETLSINQQPLTDLIAEIQQTYRSDNRPWVVGFSGGKDSTTVLELVYLAMVKLKPEERHKPLFVVSSDTLVETPVVVNLVKETLQQINETAAQEGIPMTAHQVYPNPKETFWVNLLGKGYPAPTTRFRWCTERLKITPINRFILDKISKYQEVIIVLGSRRQESTARAQSLKKKQRLEGSRLAKHTLPSAYIYTPIETWSNDDVWEFLLSVPRPWGGDNQELFKLYKDSNAGECPLVLDTSTPSCGNSRFGCWVCTVVHKDRAMEGMIESGETWLQPLLDFRNELANTTNPEKKNEFRNFKRRTGKVTYVKGSIDNEENKEVKHIPGPYWLTQRQKWLKELLILEKQFQAQGYDLKLLTEPELHQIRKEWIDDPNEPDWADSLPRIYQEVYGRDLNWVENDAGSFTKPDAELLEELETKYAAPAPMIMKLLELELTMDGLSKRSGIFQKIEAILTQDWETLEAINTRNQGLNADNDYEERYQTLRKEYLKLK